MYTEFYALQSYAFDAQVSVSTLFAWAGFREAQARLRYVVARRGLSYVTGPAGVGKTTALRALRDALPGDGHRVAYVPSPAMSTRALLRHVSGAFGLPEANAFARVVAQLRDHLWTLHQRHITPVVLLDDAQAASLDALEALRTLANFDMDSQPVVAILFAGQPTFASHLRLPAYQALAQRMVQPYDLLPMRVEETAAYIHHHLHHAGASEPVFQHDALGLIHHATKGVARQINRLCDMALLQGAAQQQRPITPALIQDLLDDIGTLG